MNKEIIKAVVRLIASFVFIVNAVLTAKGCNPIPFDENLIGEVIGLVLAFGSVAWAWWKNENITEQARLAQQYLNIFKADGGLTAFEELLQEFDDVDEEE